MGRRQSYLVGCTAIGLTAAAISTSAQTVTYTYDALGRLRSSSTTGGPNNGTDTAICYDAASNRERYVTTIGSAASCTPSPYPTPTPSPAPTPIPTPTPTPTPGNQPPNAVADVAYTFRCDPAGVSIAVLANDSDPEGNTPLVVLSVSGASIGTATVVSGTTIFYQPNGFSSGIESLTYQVRDSLGATSTGPITVHVQQGNCGPDP